MHIEHGSKLVAGAGGISESYPTKSTKPSKKTEILTKKSSEGLEKLSGI
jgi:hypothetical protein